MAVLCIGAEQIKVLWGFSDDSRCTVAGHKLNDRKPWNRQCATDFEAHKDLLIAPSLDALCRVSTISANKKHRLRLVLFCISNRISPSFKKYVSIFFAQNLLKRVRKPDILLLRPL